MKSPPGCGPWTPRRKQPPGFTLLELVTVLAIVAVLLALAVPGYQRFAQRAERAEAVRALLAAAACQERIRAQTGYYDTTRCLDGAASANYALRIEPADRRRRRDLHPDRGAAAAARQRHLRQPQPRPGGDARNRRKCRRTGGLLGRPLRRPTRWLRVALLPGVNPAARCAVLSATRTRCSRGCPAVLPPGARRMPPGARSRPAPGFPVPKRRR
jgi:prepilin-type N-terminal cleavage/methylation domain-containing protein